jgi:hypothetical protein
MTTRRSRSLNLVEVRAEAAGQIEAMRNALRAFLARRLPPDISADEFVADVIAEATERVLAARKAELTDSGRLRALCWTIARRRLYDSFRAHYRARAQEASDPSGAVPAETSVFDRLSARLTLLKLADLLDQMPITDRELIATTFSPRARLLTASERMQLARLRKQLRTALEDTADAGTAGRGKT